MLGATEVAQHVKVICFCLLYIYFYYFIFWVYEAWVYFIIYECFYYYYLFIIIFLLSFFLSFFLFCFPSFPPLPLSFSRLSNITFFLVTLIESVGCYSCRRNSIVYDGQPAHWWVAISTQMEKMFICWIHLFNWNTYKRNSCSW